MAVTIPISIIVSIFGVTFVNRNKVDIPIFTQKKKTQKNPNDFLTNI